MKTGTWLVGEEGMFCPVCESYVWDCKCSVRVKEQLEELLEEVM